MARSSPRAISSSGRSPALRQKGQQIDLKSDPSDAQLRKALDEVTPQIMVEAVDEMLHRPARQRARLQAERRTIQERRRQHPQGKQDRDRRAVPGGAETGEHDDGRPAPQFRAPDDRASACSRTKCSARSASPRTRRAEYYDAHLDEFTTPPTVTLREILVVVAGRRRQGINVAADEAAKAKADAIRARAPRPARTS